MLPVTLLWRAVTQKLRQLQVLVWSERGTWGSWTCWWRLGPSSQGWQIWKASSSHHLLFRPERSLKSDASVVPAALLSAKGAGLGAYGCRTRTEFFRGGADHEEMISWCEKIKYLEKLETSLCAALPVHCIQPLAVHLCCGGANIPERVLPSEKLQETL